MLLDDDIHNILAFIDGKVGTFLWKIFKLYIRISAAAPLPYTTATYPAKQPPLPSSEKETIEFFLLSVQLNLWSICNSTTAESILRIWYRYMKVYGSLGKELSPMAQMAAMPIYGKNHWTSFTPAPGLVTWYV